MNLYYRRWLADPKRIDIESKMPTYATNGRTAFSDALGLDAAQQFEAIWQYLQTLR